MADSPIQTVLRQLFGFSSFRPNQEEIIRAILSGRDVLAVMPTGGGKSLCYQLPAVVQKGTCVVVSPLLSLMKDQVDSAREIGIEAATLNSTTDRDDFLATVTALESGELDLLYISPERFNAPGFLERLAGSRISFFAVDEAHCISAWGHQFRPDYLALGRIAEIFPKAKIAAFTATATERVSDDIKNLLGLRNPFCVRASFDRPNLHYRVVAKTNLAQQLTDFLETVPHQAGIIYRATRKKVEETAETLKKRGWSVRPYHAGMSDADRIETQNAFARDQIQIVVATVAFGMGIDKSNVRFVVHADLPRNIESYYQETGRAGRDGSLSQCILFFGYQDAMFLRSLIEREDEAYQRESALQKLQEMVHYAESDQCRRKALLRYFGEEYRQENCGGCDFCRNEIHRIDATIDAQKALSAMQRTGNRFGIGYLIDLLVGADSARLKSFGHDRLPTYGVGQEKPKAYWRHLYNALIARGAAAMKPDTQFPIPQVTEYGWGILRGQKTFEVAPLPVREKKSRRAAATKLLGEPLSADRLLFERLRQLRMKVALERGVPPYVIFTDKTLLEMAAVAPKTADEMLAVSGVGEKKMAAYGAIFLAACAEPNAL